MPTSKSWPHGSIRHRLLLLAGFIMYDLRALNSFRNEYLQVYMMGVKFCINLVNIKCLGLYV